MRRRKLVISAALATLALAVLLGRRGAGPVTVTLNGAETPVTLAEDRDVYLTVEPAAVSSTGAVVVLHREGVPQIGYGDAYYIAQKERHNSRKWTEVPWLDQDEPSWWPSMTVMGFDPDGASEEARLAGETEMAEDWTDIYGPLEPGEYLFVKEVMDPTDPAAGRYIGAQFTVK